MTGNVLTVNTKATLTISTLTIIPGCCRFLLLTSSSVTSVFLSFISSSVCSWHWFALSSPLPLSSLNTSHPAARDPDKRTRLSYTRRIPTCLAFSVSSLLGMRFVPNIRRLEDKERHAGQGRVVFICQLMTWLTQTRGFSCAPGCFFVDIHFVSERKRYLNGWERDRQKKNPDSLLWLWAKTYRWMKEEIPQKAQNSVGAENGRFARRGVSSQFRSVFTDLNGAVLFWQSQTFD